MLKSEWFLEEYGTIAPDGNPRSQSSVAASSAVDSVLGRLQANDGNAARTFRALKLWRRMSDARVRSHTHGVFLDAARKQPELVVYVDHSVWMYEFNMMKEALLVEWNMLCADDADLHAANMSFRLSTRARQAGQDGCISTTAIDTDEKGIRSDLPELSVEERREVERAASAINDSRLRLKAEKAIEMTLRRKKTTK